MHSQGKVSDIFYFCRISGGFTHVPNQIIILVNIVKVKTNTKQIEYLYAPKHFLLTGVAVRAPTGPQLYAQRSPEWVPYHDL